MKQAQSWRCVMDVVGLICFFVGLLLLGGLLVLPALFLPTAKKLRSWLKGSRTSYYLCPSKKEMLPPTKARLRTYEDRNLFTEGRYDIDGPIIEIRQGFLRRSGIYGQVLPHWQIKRVWSVKNLDWPLGNWVSLVDNE
ncbi:MAG: hypothetical protein AAB857_02835, partial [Patescibacteria group bacterium]